MSETDKTINPNDIHVGTRVAACREQAGLTQTELGEVIGVSVQQVENYERGTNRIDASHLLKIARTLNTSVSTFFQDLAIAGAGSHQAVDCDPREGIELLRAFTSIPSREIRDQLVEYVRHVAVHPENSFPSRH